MTKKVLISLEDMITLWDSAVEICGREDSPFKVIRPDMTKEDFRFGARILEHVLNDWFDAQPDIASMIQDYEAAKNLFKGAIPMLDEGLQKIESALSKMETTGDKDDN